MIETLHTKSNRTDQTNKLKTEGNDEDDAIMSSANNNKFRTQTSGGGHRSLMLFQMAKPHNQRRDRDKMEIEYEKQCDECTFQPDILLNRRNNKVVEAKTEPMEKTVQRLKQARLSKYTLEELRSNGTTQNDGKRNST